MADQAVTTKQIVLDLTLSKDNEVETRRITFDNNNDAILPDVKDALKEQFIPSLVGGGLSHFIQPSGWRDEDEAEEEWACTLVEAQIITKTVNTLDLS